MSLPFRRLLAPLLGSAFSMRLVILLNFSLLLLVVIGSLLYASFSTGRRITQRLAEDRMLSMRREAEAALSGLFKPIHQHATEGYAAIKLGRYSSRDPIALQSALLPSLHSLGNVESLMLGDAEGRQFLVMRYIPAVYRSPMLASVADSLPAPAPGDSFQYFTRDFRPGEWGIDSRWTLWDANGRGVLKSWVTPLPGYDSTQRPWYKAAVKDFRDLSLEESRPIAPSLVAWTDVYQLFTTKSPGISASVAARDPSGRLLVLAFDLLLEEVSRFTSTAHPSPNGRLAVFTEEGRLLGTPLDAAADARARSDANLLQPVGEAAYPQLATAFALWKTQEGGKAGQFRALIDEQPWWLGFSHFHVSQNRSLWVAVLIPEADLASEVRLQQDTVVGVGLIAWVVAIVIGALLARHISRPLSELSVQARRIAALDLERPAGVQSSLRELRQLAETLEQTREALRLRIAERERDRQALAESAQQLRTLSENSPDIILRFDSAGRHLYANSAHERATGFSLPEIRGKTLQEVAYPPALSAAWKAVLDRVLSSRQSESFEFVYPTAHGDRHMESRVSLEPSADGEETVLVVVHDVTERVEVAAALRRGEARYRSLIEAASVGIIVQNRSQILYMNPAASRILGYEGRGIDRPMEKFCVDPAQPLLMRQASELAERGEVPPPMEDWQLRRPDGKLLWVQSSVISIEWDGARSLLWFLRDVTDLNAAREGQLQLESQLRQSQKLEAVGLLAGGIAHDFNNLLQVIGGNAQLGLLPDSTDEDRAAALEEVSKTAQSALKLTRQLLSFSRRQALVRHELDLNRFLEESLTMLRRVLPESIQTRLVRGDDPVLVSADDNQLEQVLLNLCINARDAMAGRGELLLECRLVALEADQARRLGRAPGSAMALLAVSDTGHGMDEATIQRIFEPFFTTKSRENGTGLGLAVVYGIIE